MIRFEIDVAWFARKTNSVTYFSCTQHYLSSQSRKGVCIKLITLINNQKFFINLCQSDAIPQPVDITGAELYAQIENVDQPTTYRIPMSISELRNVMLRDTPVQCCDIVIHPQFLIKSQADELFGDFLIQVMIEAIDAKYSIQLDGGKCVTLKNRKHLGTLLRHRIQNRDIETVKDSTEADQPSDDVRARLAELDTRNGVSASTARRPLIEMLPETTAATSTTTTTMTSSSSSPTSIGAAQAIDDSGLEKNTRLVLSHDKCWLVGEFYLPQLNDPTEIELDVGADRMRVSVPSRGLVRDGHVRQKIDTEHVVSEWIAEKSVRLKYSNSCGCWN